ncbi:MAG: hypothetical protein JW966_12840 [Anaerolineae bacterium]|nr:hypothetical protein [Anaerolineae bacterium]
MRQVIAVLGLVIVVIGVVVARVPAHAQDDFTPEQQAALDDVRAAYANFLALDTYQADYYQIAVQDISMTYQEQSVDIDQVIESNGDMQIALSAGGAFPDQSFVIQQTISQTISGASTDESLEEINQDVYMITVDDRIFYKIESSGDQAALMPQGWQEITADSSMFPGMGIYNINQIMQLSGNALDLGYMEALLETPNDVELLGPDTIDGQAVNRYRLDVSISATVDYLGMDNLVAMFDGSELGIDMEALLAMIYDDENTLFQLEVAISAGDQMLVEVTSHTVLDVSLDIGALSDVMPEGTVMNLIQDSITTLTLRDFNEPVDIAPPPLGE